MRIIVVTDASGWAETLNRIEPPAPLGRVEQTARLAEEEHGLEDQRGVSMVPAAVLEPVEEVDA